MDRFDFSPLFRSTIGFDRLARLVDAATHVDSTALSYPPYNIEKVGEDAYRLTMAVAGFSRDEIDIVVQENTLFVTGKAQKEDENGRYLHRGIARRTFELVGVSGLDRVDEHDASPERVCVIRDRLEPRLAQHVYRAGIGRQPLGP